MLQITDLQPGDVIVSRKAVKPWQLANRFFNWRVHQYSLKVFGKDAIYPQANHTRIVAGRDMDDIVWTFHATFPFAGFERAEPWLVDPAYSMAYRYSFGEATMGDYMGECLKYESKLYDIGQILDTSLGLRKFFDFGPNHHYCSSVVYAIQQKLLGLDIPIETSKAPPCMWSNYPDLFYHLNPVKPGALHKHLTAPLLCEPT